MLSPNDMPGLVNKNKPFLSKLVLPEYIVTTMRKKARTNSHIEFKEVFDDWTCILIFLSLLDFFFFFSNDDYVVGMLNKSSIRGISR